MLEDVSVSDVIKTGKDVGTINKATFQIIYGSDEITLKAPSVSEKRQWINQIEAAKKICISLKSKTSSPNKLKGNNLDTIGTLNLILLEASNCLEIVKNRQIFAVGQIRDQVLKSKIVDGAKPIFNQPLIFTLSSLDSSLLITLFQCEKYTADVYLGQAEIQLDFLEYYAGNQTEVIKLDLKDGGYESITIKMVYRPT
jgi:hypothetical protein